MIALPERDNLRTLSSIPWASLAFALITLLIFVIWQGNQDQAKEDVIQDYLDSGLAEMEWPYYLSHLRIRGDVPLADRLEAERETEGSSRVLFYALTDRQFVEAVSSEPERYWQAHRVEGWQENRARINQALERLPVVRAGLQPATPRPAAFLTFHFLNADIWHWLLAMLVLLPFAWALEVSLGSSKTLLIWPLSAIIASAAGAFMLRGHVLPIVGSSVMASAMAGMYAGYFSTRRIRFGLPMKKGWMIREWPAFFMLPLWLLLPVLAMVSEASPGILALQVAALISGAVLVQLVHLPDMSWLLDDEEDQDDAALKLRRDLTAGWAALGSMEFAEAEKRFLTACKQAPDSFNAVNGLYQVRKLKPDDNQFLATVQRMLKMALSSSTECRQQQMAWREATGLLGDRLRLPEATRWQLVENMSRIDAVTDAETLAAMDDTQPPGIGRVRALTELGRAFSRRGNAAKAAHFVALAERAREALAKAAPAPDAVAQDAPRADKAPSSPTAAPSDTTPAGESVAPAAGRNQDREDNRSRAERPAPVADAPARPEEREAKPDQQDNERPAADAGENPPENAPEGAVAQAVQDVPEKPETDNTPGTDSRPAADRPRAVFAARDPETPAASETVSATGHSPATDDGEESESESVADPDGKIVADDRADTVAGAETGTSTGTGTGSMTGREPGPDSSTGYEQKQEQEPEAAPRGNAPDQTGDAINADAREASAAGDLGDPQDGPSISGNEIESPGIEDNPHEQAGGNDVQSEEGTRVPAVSGEDLPADSAEAESRDHTETQDTENPAAGIQEEQAEEETPEPDETGHRENNEPDRKD